MISSATRSPACATPPSSSRESCARRQYRCASCSQVAPIAAVHGDAGSRRVIGRLLGGEARRARGQRQLLRPRLGGVAGVEAEAACGAGVAEDLDDLLLDRLVGADRPAERVPVLGVGDGQLEHGLGHAQRIRREQRLRQIPGLLEIAGVDLETFRFAAVEVEVAERSRGVVSDDRLDLDLVRRDQAGVVAVADDQPVGTGQVGLEARLPRDRGALLSRGECRQQGVLGACQEHRCRQVPDQPGAREATPALLEHQHGVERIQPRTAVLFGDEQPGPARLARGRPQLEQLGAVQRGARARDGIEPRERVDRRLAQHLLLSG